MSEAKVPSPHHHHHRHGNDHHDDDHHDDEETSLRRQDSRTLRIHRQNSGEKKHGRWPKEYANKA